MKDVRQGLDKVAISTGRPVRNLEMVRSQAYAYMSFQSTVPGGGGY